MTAALHVVFRPARGALAALPARHVRETMRPLPIEPLAGAPSFVAGAAIVRGRAVPVVDAATLFSGARDERDAATRWIAIVVGDRDAVLAVHSVVGVRALAATNDAVAPLLARSARGAIAELSTLDGELLAILQTAKLVDEEVWRAIAGQDDAR
ncbi:MAG: CheW domain-containing protein [Labilithrix sp.]|nr:CheW domain-containing protein [Labilithrix sp.]MCW5815424.1 CheW domain-containing protein [Labilithrix sp.]